ncbi:DUF2264 domain-containing protein [Nonomuraea sp. SBT364]|uniref:DUF2264 domain-containing protein n=1 Tax=Nonomuraea sp. SBT364 TaxID=1580530 RepID=UPI00069D8400|nr:DUF2264 domain-containing protein [Nonomuraea sp. SBT364]
MFDLPDEDRRLSPYTGWTRRHWEAVADGLLAAAEPYRSPDGASIRLPGRASWSDCDGMEGFARTFLIAAFRVAGGGPPESLAPYRSGFVNGPDVWPAVADRFQPMVECASLALGLWLTREHLWDTLSGGERVRLARYLATVFDHEPADNNWRLFPVTVGGFLTAAGSHADASRAAVADGLARIEPWYAGSGWYSDGPNRAFDHYNGWALHFYPALYGLLSGTPMSVHEARLREFLDSFALTFAADGRPLYQGRSMTYRFATAAALMVGAVTGHTPLSPGATRRLTSGALRHALEHGALSEHGLLTLGWYGPHEATLPPYSGSASPYWAAKAFAGLLAPADHPLWTATEEAGPEGTAVLPGPGLLVVNTGGIARVINHGSQDKPGDPLYDRYAYSSHTGPTAPGEIPDNHFGLVQADGTLTSRGRIQPRGAGALPGRGDLAWASSAAGAVESLTVIRGGAEVRVHRVAPGTRVRQSGWALPGAGAVADGRAVCLTSPGGSRSRLVGLHGYASASAHESTPGTAFGSPALVPVLDGLTGDGWAVALAVLDGAGDDADPSVRVAPDGRLTVAWPDGIRATVELRTGQEGLVAETPE